MVYELDQPQVIGFKTAAMAAIGAEPTATRRTVSIDLREDWPAALRVAGWDPAAPTAWCAEGLLIYLPGEAQDMLFDDITALSAPGSTVATEYAPGIRDFDAQRAGAMSANLRDQGLELDMPSLVYSGDRSQIMEYLTGKGWQVTGVPAPDLFLRTGLEPPEVDSYDPLGGITYVSATLAGAGT